MSEVTMKSTKQQIFDKLQEVTKENEEMKTLCSLDNTTASVQKKTVEAAKKDVKANIFSEEMNKKFTNLQEAIAIQEEQLKELYGIEKELLDITNVINASKQLKVENEKEIAAWREEVGVNQQKELAKIAEKVKVEENKALDLKAQLEKERERENDEYEYNLARKRKMEEDEYASKKAIRDKEDAEKAAALDAREKALSEREEEITVMAQEIADFDNRLKDSYNEGYKDGEKAAGKEYGYKKSLADKEYEYEVRTLNDKIESLTALLQEKTDKVANLESKLDEAYTKINTLATSTVEASGSIKVVGGVSNTGK